MLVWSFNALTYKGTQGLSDFSSGERFQGTVFQASTHRPSCRRCSVPSVRSKVTVADIPQPSYVLECSTSIIQMAQAGRYNDTQVFEFVSPLLWSFFFLLSLQSWFEVALDRLPFFLALYLATAWRLPRRRSRIIRPSSLPALSLRSARGTDFLRIFRATRKAPTGIFKPLSLDARPVLGCATQGS